MSNPTASSHPQRSAQPSAEPHLARRNRHTASAHVIAMARLVRATPASTCGNAWPGHAGQDYSESRRRPRLVIRLRNATNSHGAAFETKSPRMNGCGRTWPGRAGQDDSENRRRLRLVMCLRNATNPHGAAFETKASWMNGLRQHVARTRRPRRQRESASSAVGNTPQKCAKFSWCGF